MNQSIQTLVEASKSQPTHQQLSQELWKSVQPILTAQRELAEIQHNTHMELIGNMVEARYKDTQADINGIKEALKKMMGTTPAPIFENDDDQDDAKNGEKHDMKKFGKPTPRQKPTQKPEPEKKSSATSAETSINEKEKGIDETLNIQADEEAANRKTVQNKNATKERILKKEQKELKNWEIKTKDLGTSDRRKSHKHNKPPLATYPRSPSPPKQTSNNPEKQTTDGLKTTAGIKKPSTATPKPTPPPQKQPAKKHKTKPSSPISSSTATNVDTSIVVKTAAVETPVVLTVVSQSTTSTTFQFPSQAIFILISNSSTKTPSPKFVYTRKIKFQVNDDDIHAPTPLSSSPFI
ncbi:hypothetical protein Hanom_Chr15g01411571 [Helianthus anomalus]